MIGPKRILFTFVVIVVCIGCDQATKSLASYQLSGSEPVGVIGEVFRLEYTENSGAMLGVGADLSEGTRFWLFTVFAACALLGILTFTIADTKLKTTDILSLSLILGGGISADFEKYSRLLKTRAQLLPAFYRNQAGVIGAAMYASLLMNLYKLPE